MADRLPRLVAAAFLLALFLSSLALPAAMLAVPRPGESCPDTTPAPGATPGVQSTDTVCGEGTNIDPGGGGSVDLAALLPIVATVAAGGVLVLVVAFVVLRRRASVPDAPADPGEWWTCRKCASTNVIDSPRCYACGSWQS